MHSGQQAGRRLPPPAVPGGTDAAAAFPDEAAHLEEISQKLGDAFRRANESVHQIDGEYTDLKRYMVENRGEIDPHEMFQNEQTLARVDQSGARAADLRSRIAKLMDSPYFARVDFLPSQAREAVPYYIGRFGFSHGNRRLIVDWRAPVAGMFYDCEIGPAAYTAPAGRVRGRLARKRQYKIHHGILEYVLESSTNIQDDVLQRELSHTSDEKMKSIINTIQKEQNRIIREESAETLIIQGVAGSGKTSVALHRIAFLLYRFQDSLSARNIAILSPSKVFGDYISRVLPELGEEPVFSPDLADIADIQLEGLLRFRRETDPFETGDPGLAERTRVKSTWEFLDRLKRYRQEMPKRVLRAQDCDFGGRFTAEADWIQARYDAYAPDPVMRRLRRIAGDLRDRFETEAYLPGDLPTIGTIVKALRGMLRIRSSIAVYRDFYRQAGCAGMFVMPEKKTLEWSDVYPFLYLHAAFAGIRESKEIRHLVIDEMQDYTPVQYAVLNQLFPCRKTILGDFGQRANPNHLFTIDDILRLYDGSKFIRLNKSYRSTCEIVRFAARIQTDFPPTPIARHGEKPSVISFPDRDTEIRYLKERINAFARGRSATLGMIVKTERAAEALYQALKGDGVYRIGRNSRRFENGACVVSVPMSKGLEFDEVLIPSADDATYQTEADAGLMYIACTRAMHRLTLTYTGQPAKLLRGETATASNL